MVRMCSAQKKKTLTKKRAKLITAYQIAISFNGIFVSCYWCHTFDNRLLFHWHRKMCFDPIIITQCGRNPYTCFVELFAPIFHRCFSAVRHSTWVKLAKTGVGCIANFILPCPERWQKFTQVKPNFKQSFFTWNMYLDLTKHRPILSPKSRYDYTK